VTRSVESINIFIVIEQNPIPFMWANLLNSTESTKERLTSALERTGEAISKTASQSVKTSDSSVDIGITKNNGTEGEATTSTTPTEHTTGQTDAPDDNTKSNPQSFNWKQAFSDKEKQNEMLDSFRIGLGSVLEATKQAVDNTKEAVQKEQEKIERMQASFFQKGPYKRGESAHHVIFLPFSLYIHVCPHFNEIRLHLDSFRSIFASRHGIFDRCRGCLCDRPSDNNGTSSNAICNKR
jgi:hypothetical protein